jgi:hypothetical protein
VSAGRPALPDSILIGVRWEPILLDRPVATTVVAGPSAADAPADPPGIALVYPEEPSTVIEPAAVRHTQRGVSTPVTFPDDPGVYRLIATVHQPSGVAYDRATQDLLRPLIVRVSAPVSVAYGVASALDAEPGRTITLPVRVVNSGSKRWEREIEHGLITRLPALVEARWVSFTANRVPDGAMAVLDPAHTAPGRGTVVALDLVAPTEPGEYLLVLDVDSPDLGLLSALGAGVATVRVHVAAVPSP